MPVKPETPEEKAVLAHLAELRAEIATLAKQVAAAAETRARTTLEGLAVAGAEPLGEAQAEIKKLTDEAKAYTTAKPLQTIGIAAGVGLLIGLILGRR